MNTEIPEWFPYLPPWLFQSPLIREIIKMKQDEEDEMEVIFDLIEPMIEKIHFERLLNPMDNEDYWMTLILALDYLQFEDIPIEILEYIHKRVPVDFFVNFKQNYEIEPHILNILIDFKNNLEGKTEPLNDDTIEGFTYEIVIRGREINYCLSWAMQSGNLSFFNYVYNYFSVNKLLDKKNFRANHVKSANEQLWEILFESGSIKVYDFLISEGFDFTIYKDKIKNNINSVLGPLKTKDPVLKNKISNQMISFLNYIKSKQFQNKRVLHDLIESAIRNDSVLFVKYLQEEYNVNLFDSTKYTTLAVEGQTSFDTFVYLISIGCSYDIYRIIFILFSNKISRPNRLKFVKYLCENEKIRYKFTDKKYTNFVAQLGHIELLQYLISQNCPYDYKELLKSVMYPHEGEFGNRETVIDTMIEYICTELNIPINRKRKREEGEGQEEQKGGGYLFFPFF